MAKSATKKNTAKKSEKEKIKKVSTTEEVEEVETEEKEEFFEEKKPSKKEKEEKSLASRIINVILWIVVFIWMGICLFDFFRAHEAKKPVFCLKEETTVYSDGEVYSCLGLGYKVYIYDRASFNGIEYGPFWSKDRSAEKDND